MWRSRVFWHINFDVNLNGFGASAISSPQLQSSHRSRSAHPYSNTIFPYNEVNFHDLTVFLYFLGAIYRSLVVKTVLFIKTTNCSKLLYVTTARVCSP